jgi:aminopeptidase
MVDKRLTKLADILVNYSVKVQPGDWALIASDPVADPLLAEIAIQILKAGGHYTLILDSDTVDEAYYQYASDEQLAWVSPTSQLAFEKADHLINVRASQNTRSLAGIDPQKQQKRQLGQKELIATYRARSASGDLRWVIGQYPCLAYAQEADMSLRDYEDFVFKACFADKDDPVGEWQAIHDEQARLIDWLKGKKDVVVRGPNADLTLSIDGRSFINADGEKNMPSGEIYTSPVEDSANGWVNFTYPAVRAGREVEGVHLEFKNGKVVNASAEKSEAYLISQLDLDEGSRYLGEFAIGTNFGIQQFTKNILFDEKIGGTFHMAIGNGFPQAGSQNKSIVHWDFICDMRDDSEILIDGELFYKNGEFKV